MRKYSKAVLIVALGALTACGKNNAEKKVLAKVGSLTVTEADVTKELENAPPVYRNYLTTLEGKKQFIDVMIKEKVMLNAAEKAGVSKKEDIQKQIQQFEERIEKQRQDYRKNLILREYLQQLQQKDLNVSDQDIKAYYEQNKANFDAPLAVSVSHILTPSQDQAQEVLARLKKGEKFETLAQAISKDPSSMRGGSIGSFRRGDLSDLPEFENAVFALKEGEVSDPVKTKLGYHVIRRDKDNHLPAQSLKEAEAYIRRILEKQKFDTWIAKEKQSQSVTIDEKALDAIDLGPKKQAEQSNTTEAAALAEPKNKK